jgi:hypothetical protein
MSIRTIITPSATAPKPLGILFQLPLLCSLAPLAINDLRIDDLRIDVGALPTDMNARFDKIDEKIDGNFKSMVTVYLTTMGIVLAGFYAFASYMTK